MENTATPKNAIELDYNNEILAKAELIRCRRQEAVINEEFGFMDRHKMRADFMAYFKEVCRKKDHKWHIVYLHFEKFVNGKCMFGEITVDLCNRFRDYLLHARQLKHTTSALPPVGNWIFSEASGMQKKAPAPCWNKAKPINKLSRRS